MSDTLNTPTVKDRLAELLELARDQNHKITRDEFAAKCHITRGQLDGYLKGNCEPLWEALRKIALYNGVTVSWLIGETEDRLTANIPLREALSGLTNQELRIVEEFALFLKAKNHKIP